MFSIVTSFFQASVLAQTRIQYNDRDLLQLIQQHLISKGMQETADALSREAGLPPIRPVPPPPSTFHSPFQCQRQTSTPVRVRLINLSINSFCIHTQRVLPIIMGITIMGIETCLLMGKLARIFQKTILRTYA